ncbi:FKBP-type peptidyl-prolyl cis-trans isomerase [Marinobacter sp. M1N3S26]|uniref:FKBP-type peptidyl-prolyl cis-trans isomerase n=1 Tax=Marinobacter sp. M1N3S26 TaxID=3382299 RepID=UPI00387AAA83
MRKYTVAAVALLIGTVSMGAYSEQSQPGESEQKTTVANEEQPFFDDLDDRYSYAYGAELAKNFKAEGVALDVDMLATAMREVFDGDEMKMSDGEIAATIEIYQRIHNKKKDAERAVEAEKNEREGEAFLAENANKDGVVITESGLQYKVITEGDGDYNPTADDEVTVHYRGTYVDGTEFDSTYSRNEPYTVEVKRLIEGWAEALQLMSVGSRWELYIPSDIAYGEEGAGQYVGPNAVLVFDVELLEINKMKDS